MIWFYLFREKVYFTVSAFYLTTVELNILFIYIARFLIHGRLRNMTHSFSHYWPILSYLFIVAFSFILNSLMLLVLV